MAPKVRGEAASSYWLGPEWKGKVQDWGSLFVCTLDLELVVGFALFSFLFFEIVTCGCQTPDSPTLEHGLMSVAL